MLSRILTISRELCRKVVQNLGEPVRLCLLKNIKGEVVDRPKALGDIRGMTYIYGMFYRFGLIDVPDKVKEKMGRPKDRNSK